MGELLFIPDDLFFASHLNELTSEVKIRLTRGASVNGGLPKRPTDS